MVWLDARAHNDSLGVWQDLSGNDNHANVSGIFYDASRSRFVLNTTSREEVTLEGALALERPDSRRTTNRQQFLPANHTVFSTDLIRIDLDIGPDNFADLTIELFFQPIELESPGAAADADDGGSWQRPDPRTFQPSSNFSMCPFQLQSYLNLGGYDRSLLFNDERYRGDGPSVGAGTGSPFNSGVKSPFLRCWHHAFAGESNKSALKKV